MYAVFQVAGFQFAAEEGTTVRVPTIAAEKGATVSIPEVLLVKDNETAHVGTPYVEGASVEAEVIDTGLGKKVVVYKYKRRTKYRRTRGHRQPYTELRVKKITAPA
ncbi:MAG: 50S ribosomal protein L21 [Candidatus Zixiibacteriota bacterium]|nr:MAG: 50S ribosomal protein L21 [candidate division Zixibacteria bacterium]